jgi:ferritin
MAISEKLMNELVHQMNKEFFNEKTYLAMACYSANLQLNGFAKMFIHQAREERKHAMRFFHYVNMNGGRARIFPQEEPQNWFNSMEEALKLALQKENDTTDRIYFLTKLADDEEEWATIQFLQWFQKEQVEEVNTFRYLATRAAAMTGGMSELFGWDSDIDDEYEEEQEIAEDDFAEYEDKKKKH